MGLSSLCRLLVLGAWVLAVPAMAARIETNVIYGMHSGAALLLDAHYPEQKNGIGIVFIPGSGWHSAPGYDTAALSASPQVESYVPSLTAAGYTVFVVNHRSTPTFKYPAAVFDTERAVRYIRHHAVRFGIDPARIGGAGGSSGAHLVSLLGTRDGAGNQADRDPVNRQSAKLQAVVARAMPADFQQNGAQSSGAIANFMGVSVSQFGHKDVVEQLRQASPIQHVSAASAPFLLMHGTADEAVPFEQSERMEAALKKANVPVKLLRVDGASHHPNFKGAVNLPDYKGEMVKWFDLHLRKTGAVN